MSNWQDSASNVIHVRIIEGGEGTVHRPTQDQIMHQ